MAKTVTFPRVHLREILPRLATIAALIFAIWQLSATLIFARDMINKATPAIGEGDVTDAIPPVNRAGLERLEPRLSGLELPRGNETPQSEEDIPFTEESLLSE